MADRYASLKQGLVGCWIPSVSGSGLLLPDLSGRNNNGSLVGMDASDWVSSQYGRALDFDGSNDYIEILIGNQKRNVNNFSGDPEFSITGWLYANLLGDYDSILFFGNETAALQAASLVVMGNGATGLSFAGANNSHTTSGAILTGKWYHLAATKVPGAINATTKIYTNGVLQSLSSPSSSTPNINNSASSQGTMIASNFGTTTNGLNGQLDDIRIYNRALSEPEIRLLASEPGIGFKPAKKLSRFSQRFTYNPPKARNYGVARVKETDYATLRQGLVGGWCPSLPNGGGGNLLVDQSQRGNHGVLTNMSAGAWVSGQYGRALDFDGVDDYVSVPHSQSLNVTGAYCLAFWIRGNDTSNKVIFEKGSNLSLVFQPNGPNQLYYLDGNASPANVSNIVTSFLDGNWHHVAALFDGSNRFLFVDGLQLHTSSISPASANTSPFVMGSRSGLFPFIGSLDDVRVYSRVVTEPEIRLLASRRGIGLQPSPTKFIAREKKTGLRRILMTGQT